MDENMIVGIKIDLKEKIKRAGIVVLIIFMISSIFTMPGYLKFRKAQNILIETSALIPSYMDLNRKEKIEYLYNKYTYSVMGVSGYQADKASADLLNEMGYDCELASEYLEYSGIINYILHRMPIPYMISLISIILLLFIKRWYLKDSKKNIAIEERRIVCKNGEKVLREFLISDISSVESSRLKGIILRGNNIKYKVNLLNNAEEIKSKIIDRLEKIKTSTTVDSKNVSNTNAKEIKEYKELLDSGIITQEEFDEKKKQLLNM